eukprot:m.197762 g.197762  ORF g.197762 m.197762 type:complete len:78 (+) comp15711_c0_seq43:34-267(+)
MPIYRYKVLVDESWGLKNPNGCLLWGYIGGKDNPRVPPLAIFVPRGYPNMEQREPLKLHLEEGYGNILLNILPQFAI